jgi:polysaccharide pyruvyl transferase WcaK-like protein
MKYRILLLTCAGTGNIGDDAIFTAFIDQLRRIYINSTIGCCIFHFPEHIKKIFNIDYVWSYDEIDLLSAIKWSTHVIIGGGTLISEKPSIDFPLGYFSKLILKVRENNRNVSMIGIGTSDILSQQAKYIVRNKYKWLDFITVRNDEDKIVALKLGLNRKKIRVTADPAFLSVPNDLIWLPQGGIGINLVDEGYDNEFNISYKLANAIKLLKFQNPRIYVEGFCNEIRKNFAFDYEITNKTLKSISGDCRLHFNYSTPLEIFNIIKDYNIVITMRLHVIIFCACIGIPVVAIVREKKMELMLKSLGIKYYLNLEQNETDFYKIINDALCNPNNYIVDKEIIKATKIRAINNFKYFEEYYNSPFRSTNIKLLFRIEKICLKLKSLIIKIIHCILKMRNDKKNII